jgi:hypothetical protein
MDAQLESRAQERAQLIIADVFSKSNNVMAEVVFLQQQLKVAADKIEKLTEKNKSLHLQLEISDARCNELLLEV